MKSYISAFINAIQTNRESREKASKGEVIIRIVPGGEPGTLVILSAHIVLQDLLPILQVEEYEFTADTIQSPLVTLQDQALVLQRLLELTAELKRSFS